MADWPLKGYESAYLLVLQPLELHVNMKTETIKERKCFKKKKKKKDIKIKTTEAVLA